MKTLQGKLIVACATIVLVTAGWMWITHDNNASKPLDKKLAEQDLDNKTSPDPSVTVQWRVGTGQRYALQIDSSMSMQGDGELTTPDLDIKIAANLDMRTLEVDGESALVGYQLSSVDMQVAGKSDPQVNDALADPFRVRYVLGGIPESFEFPASMVAEHRVILENLIRMFQVNLQQGDEWLVLESTYLGHYKAAYKRLSSQQVTKTKQSFSSFATQPLFSGAMITSNESIETDPQHDWITAMTSSETLATTGQSGPALTFWNESSLALVPSADTEADPLNWTFEAAPPPSLQDSAQQVSSLSPEEARHQLLAEVDSLDLASSGRIVLIHRLRDLLRTDASQPAVLLDVMRTAELEDRTRADLYLALELAGTDHAQAALTSVVADSSWSSRDAVRAVVALGGVKKPASDTLDALWDITQSVQTDDEFQLASTAKFALGSLGKTMNLANDPRYADLQTRLMDGAMAAASTSERTNFIHALGNTQDPSLATNMLVLLRDEASSVRRATAQSLGAVGVDPVADELVSQLSGEASGSVRAAIMEALVGWSAPTTEVMQTVQSMLGSEQDENARLQMARFLGANLAAYPENESSLRQLLRVEPSKQVRQTVAEWLARNG